MVADLTEKDAKIEELEGELSAQLHRMQIVSGLPSHSCNQATYS